MLSGLLKLTPDPLRPVARRSPFPQPDSRPRVCAASYSGRDIPSTLPGEHRYAYRDDNLYVPSWAIAVSVAVALAHGETEAPSDLRSVPMTVGLKDRRSRYHAMELRDVPSRGRLDVRGATV